MRAVQLRWSGAGIVGGAEASLPGAQLVFAFGAPELVAPARAEIARRFPNAALVGCSTAGEIEDTSVFDTCLVITAIEFEQTQVRTVTEAIRDALDSGEAARRAVRQLIRDDLVHVVILAGGASVNGSAIARGAADVAPSHVKITGGLAGDGTRFSSPSVWSDGLPTESMLIAIGFYGTALRVQFGSVGGWDPFGPDRCVTRSEGNVVYELDGKPALALYRSYLGPHSAELPASGLLFPLSVRRSPGGPGVVRTILGTDEDAESLIFAGDVPQGSYARLMKANIDRVIDGAASAARQASAEAWSPQLGLLISCVGRKLVLKQRVEEEVESVREVLGPAVQLTGFYSYGEICPADASAEGELHNQTMTITTFAETGCTSSSPDS